MTSIRVWIGAGAAFLASAMAASAADLYGGRGSIKDDYIPVVQTGCASWYGRFDAGIAAYDRPSITEVNVDDYLRPSMKDSWSIGGGVGRYFTCNVRGDITYDHHFNSQVTGTNGNTSSPVNGSQKFGYSNDVVLANVYYDFDTRTRFTPYVGLGFGFARNAIAHGSGTVANGALSGGAGDTIFVNSSDNWHAAAAVMAGFSMPLRDRWSLDAGYRFLYLGQAKTGDIYDTSLGGSGGPARLEEIHAHEFRIGLRMDLGGGAPCCAAPAPLK